MSSRSERCLAKAEQCRQVADAADTSGAKRLYEELARQWLHLAKQAEETDGRQPWDRNRFQLMMSAKELPAVELPTIPSCSIEPARQGTC
jgi:hypothetical protein